MNLADFETLPETRPLVCLVLPVLQPAGAERVVAELAKRLPRHGFAVRVLCLEDEQAPVGIELSEAGVSVTGLRLSRRRSLACGRAMARWLPAHRPLILHAHLFHANLAARLACARLAVAKRREVHVLSTVHVVEHRFRPWQYFLDRVTARYCRKEICVSEEVRRFQQHRTGLPPSFFRVIENGVDLTRFRPLGDRAEPAKAPAESLTAPLVLSVGRLNVQKDFPTLLRAWQRVTVACPTAKLLIAGGGPEADRLKALTRSLQLQNVEFAGFVADVPALMQKADLYVQSSAWEGLPLSVIEAMACALPVIVTDAAGNRAVVRHEQTGLIVARGQWGPLAANIIHLLSDRQRATALATEARDEALRRFSLDRMVNDYVKLYQELLAN